MSSLRDQLQIARVNRVRARVNTWWHANHCECCRKKRELLEVMREASSFHVVPGSAPGADEPPKAH